MKTLWMVLLLLPSQDSRIHDVIEDTVPKVVKIFGASGFRNLPGHASGVIVSPEGHILTVRSVMLSARNLRVVLWDGRVCTATVLRSDRQKGMSLLKIDVDEPLPHFEPEDPGPLRVGQWVLSIANAFKLAQGDEWPSANLGVLTAITRLDLRMGVHDFPYDGEVLVTDANNNPGSFGGALVDIEGRLIGINGRILESGETETQISYAVPIRDLIPLVDGSIAILDQTEKPSRPGRHGIRLFDLGTRKSPPAHVHAVLKGSPAQKAGIRKGDLIIRCGQTPIRSCKDLMETLARYGPDEEVAITLKRKEAIHRVMIRLDAPEEEP